MVTSLAFAPVLTAVREVVNAICATVDYTPTDAKVLKFCFRVLLAAVVPLASLLPPALPPSTLLCSSLPPLVLFA